MKHISGVSATRSSRKRRDSGYLEGPSDSHKQYLDYVSVLDRLNPIDDCPGTTDTSIKHRTDESQMSEIDSSRLKEPTSDSKDSTLHILVRPPSPEANKSQLRIVSTPTTTQSKRSSDFYTRAGEMGMLSPTTVATPLETTPRFSESSWNDAETDEKLDNPVIARSIKAPTTCRTRAGRRFNRHQACPKGGCRLPRWSI